MNQLLSRWADLSAMLLSVAVSVALTIKTSKCAPVCFRPLALFFLLFGPMAICVHMAAHQFFVNFLALGKMLNGNFVYDFRFYALNLMGGLLAILSFDMLRNCLLYFKGNDESRKKWLQSAGWIVLVATPTIPFTFIGTLPLQAVIVNFAASFFVRKTKTFRVVKTAARPAHAAFEPDVAR